jgi:isopropylmalate/homocitrate/citramalate synthase
MKYKLRMSEQQVVDNAVNAVKHLRSLGCTDIEFSPEDAGGCWVLGTECWGLTACMAGLKSWVGGR